MIVSFRSKALRRYWEKSDARGLRPDWIARSSRLRNALDTASRPEDMNVPGFALHALTGDLADRFALTVARNWRVTFSWSGDDAAEIDLEDYHG